MSDTRTNAEILRAAQTRILDQRNFVMGAFAWNRQGRRVEVTAPDAARWNARGAIYAESGVHPSKWNESDRGHVLYQYLDRAAREIGGNKPYDVADNLGHPLTLQALDRAIEIAESESLDSPAPAPAAAIRGER
jgi:hypothetical protein